MGRIVDYYISPLSPWSYLGHARFTSIVQATRADVLVVPVRLASVFAAAGGLPLGQRPPQSRAYRLLELARFSERLDIPLNLHPKFFSVSPDPAARIITTVAWNDGQQAALRICGAVFAAVWTREKDVSNPTVLTGLLRSCGLPAERYEQSLSGEIEVIYEANTRRAIEKQVFGAPTYIVNGEIFWGQDRLDFVEHALGRQAMSQNPNNR